MDTSGFISILLSWESTSPPTSKSVDWSSTHASKCLQLAFGTLHGRQFCRICSLPLQIWDLGIRVHRRSRFQISPLEHVFTSQINTNVRMRGFRGLQNLIRALS
ncbi:hypothetical protein Droror1_Dr00026998 [Drosera rotundifolia]